MCRPPQRYREPPQRPPPARAHGPRSHYESHRWWHAVAAGDLVGPKGQRTARPILGVSWKPMTHQSGGNHLRKKKGRIKEELFHFFTQTVSLPTNFQKLELAPGQIALPHRQLLHLRWGTDSAALSELLSFQTSLVGRFHNPFEKI